MSDEYQMPPFRFVQIIWLDAYSEDQWSDLDTYVFTDYVVISRGYLVKETKKYWWLAPNIGLNAGKWEVGCMIGIPKKMVEEMDDYPKKTEQA